jgi:hypothetical protein
MKNLISLKGVEEWSGVKNKAKRYKKFLNPNVDFEREFLQTHKR